MQKLVCDESFPKRVSKQSFKLNEVINRLQTREAYLFARLVKTVKHDQDSSMVLVLQIQQIKMVRKKLQELNEYFLELSNTDPFTRNEKVGVKRQ